jgi:hypothetical protein
MDPGVPIRPAPTRSLEVVLDRTPVRKLEFVDIDPTPLRPQRRRAVTLEAGGAPSITAESTDSKIAERAASSIDPGEPRWSLWSDAEV